MTDRCSARSPPHSPVHHASAGSSPPTPCFDGIEDASPGTGPKNADHQDDQQPLTRPRTHPAPGNREPDLGLSAHTWRTHQPRPPTCLVRPSAQLECFVRQFARTTVVPACNKRARNIGESRSPAGCSRAQMKPAQQGFHVFPLVRRSATGCFGSRGSSVQITPTRQGKPLEQGVFRAFGVRRRTPACNKRAIVAIPYLSYVHAFPNS